MGSHYSRKGLSVAELTDTLKRMDERLDALTELFHQNHARCHPAPHHPVGSDPGSIPSPQTSQGLSPAFHLNRHRRNSTVSRINEILDAASPPFLDTGRIREDLSLSQKHTTAPQHMPAWPCSPVKLSESELQYPMLLEIERPKLSTSTMPPRCLEARADRQDWASELSLSQLNLLTRFYFEHFHPTSLVLDEGLFYNQHLNQAMRSNFSQDMDTCLAWLVCALGSIAAYHDGHEEWVSRDEHDVGLGFFNLAKELFRQVETASWSSVQCLLLMG